MLLLPSPSSHLLPCPVAHCPLQTWLKQPLTDLAAIAERHDVVEAMHGDAQLRSDLRTLHLRGELAGQGGVGWVEGVLAFTTHCLPTSDPTHHLFRPA